MKVYLDDIRATPDGWTRAYTVEECQELLKNNVVTNMSLDHDLGMEPSCLGCRENSECTEDPEDWTPYSCRCECHKERPNGYELVKWCAENGIWSTYKPTVHSANYGGRIKMIALIEEYWRPPNEPKRIRPREVPEDSGEASSST